MAGRSRRAPNSPDARNAAGAHYLTDRRVAAELVRSADTGPGDLVFDLGAGYGALTAPLTRTGARVIAVERDPAHVATLRRRFSSADVGVVHADLRTVPLPHRPYLVVANPPFATSTALLRRLLAPATRLAGADLLLQWEFALRVAGTVDRRFAFSVVRRVPGDCFTPPPRVAAAHLRIRRLSSTQRRTSAVLSSTSRRSPRGGVETPGR